jgi:predicted DNA-binding transcriptional regulator AlpA
MAKAPWLQQTRIETKSPEGGRMEAVAKKLIGIGRVLELCSFSKSTQQRLERAGNFPRRVRLSSKRVAWREAEVLEFIQSRQRVE